MLSCSQMNPTEQRFELKVKYLRSILHVIPNVTYLKFIHCLEEFESFRDTARISKLLDSEHNQFLNECKLNRIKVETIANDKFLIQHIHGELQK